MSSVRRSQAPESLHLLEKFVNTKDIEKGVDHFGSPDLLHDWLREHGLIQGDEPVSQKDLALVIEIREALRALLLGNNGAPVEASAFRVVDQEAQKAPLSIRVRQEGTNLVPILTGVKAAIAKILAIMFVAQVDGTWRRLKSCLNEECRWVFYDCSRNRSRNWCTMAMCGNRVKARAYRERHRASNPSD